MNNNFDTVREALTHSKDAIIERGLDGNPDFAERWGLTLPLERIEQALTALAQIEADHFTAADMASAAAQGFRDGVASVTQGEPVAWMCTETKVLYDHDTSEVDKHHGFKPTVPLYAAPVAKQPAVPEGYALIGIDALKAWGVYDQVRDACQYPVAQQPQSKPMFTDLIAHHPGLREELAQQPQAEASCSKHGECFGGECIYSQQAEAVPPKRATGWVAPKDRYITPVLFNPYTGEPRNVLDVQSDPQGILIVPPGAQIAAAQGAKT